VGFVGTSREGRAVKTLVRAAIVVSGAAGLLFALGLAARADVANPASTYQSAFKIAQMRDPAPAPVPAKSAPSRVQAPVQRVEPAATPVPEQFVSQAPAPVVAPREHGHGSVVSRIVFGAEAKYRDIEAFFGRAASASPEGTGAGAGVPVLVLGVLGAAAVFDHHRRGNRWAADENALELLYARELTPPG
jgi:hypothetical protein